MSHVNSLPVISKTFPPRAVAPAITPTMTNPCQGRQNERNERLGAIRPFGQSLYTAWLWFCCVLFLLAMPVSQGWAAANDRSAPFGACAYPEGFSPKDLDESIVIAVAGPLKTEKGLEMLRGNGLRLEEFNRAGEIPGKNVVLLECDDGIGPGNGSGEEDRKEKEKKWREIASTIVDSEALVVLGHRSSDASIAAGAVYRDREIPAITATAQADEITEGNPWYFRTISQGSRQVDPPPEGKGGAPEVRDRKFVLTLTVHTHPEEDPDKVKGLLQDAVDKIVRDNRSQDTQGILPEPAPAVKFLGIREHPAGGYMAAYHIMVSIEDYGKKKAYADHIWHEVWRRPNGAGYLRSAFAG
uniref:Substrate-binding protein n=1 Tax=Candidatus Kentrum eta TaxID=2126337 RepID=A0A450UJR6_9GAMM|nr:MAG: hypothetical protein BECKH772A_GA0070896_100487 [Candidatus Kentron sp. H]VFJ93870.1 MAG: hypothetical protein BECKH772B_GA0070898_100526 [Candidatus Kentron sp. H]VFK00383.1 MAG: hypothetical protein BECKH772C_GA0070978_100457 [Candidatus Kentron sp. H]